MAFSVKMLMAAALPDADLPPIAPAVASNEITFLLNSVFFNGITFLLNGVLYWMVFSS